MSSFVYFLRESFIGFTRNLSTALGSIVTIFLSLLIIGIFFVGGVVVDNVVTSVESEVSLAAYVADDANEADTKKVMSYLEGVEGVQSVGFTTKDQALEKFRATSNSEILDTLDGKNPLPASIDVELSDPQMVEAVAKDLAAHETYKKICDNPSDPDDSLKYGEKTVQRLFSLTNYIRYIGVALVGLLVFIALVFINNTIRLAILARRKEIAIMRLVGASNGFIRGPFLMEGALHAAIGSLLAILVLELLRVFALAEVQGALAWLPIDLGAGTFALIYASLIAFGLIIGLIGSALAMRRYLKV